MILKLGELFCGTSGLAQGDALRRESEIAVEKVAAVGAEVLIWRFPK